MDQRHERLTFELRVHGRAGMQRWLRPPASQVGGITAQARVPATATPKASAPVLPVTALTSFNRSPPPSGPTAPVGIGSVSDLTTAERHERLAQLSDEVRACTKCKLCEYRTNAVPGEGAIDPPILFIGEGPGEDEDASGRPFVGRAGQLLDKMIGAIRFRRDELFIANLVKCRPPQNRNPEPDEASACLPYLVRQIELLRPRLICTLGLPATRALLPDVRSISAVRGRLQQWNGLPLIPTFHPAYLLRTPEAKHDAWNDLKLVARTVGRPVDGAS